VILYWLLSTWDRLSEIGCLCKCLSRMGRTRDQTHKVKSAGSTWFPPIILNINRNHNLECLCMNFLSNYIFSNLCSNKQV